MLANVRDIFLAIKQIAPLRWGLVFLFMLLTSWELVDGQASVGDVVLPFLFAILIHTIFTRAIHRQGPVQDRPGGVRAFLKRVRLGAREALLADSSKLSRSERATKILMNNFFLLLFVFAVVAETVNTPELLHIQAYAFVAWSAVFLAFNVKDFMRTMSFARLLVTNIALFLMLGSVALL